MSAPKSPPLAVGYAFGPFVVDTVRRAVWAEHGPIALSSKAFDLLLVLMANRDRIVTKEELLAEVWPGTFVQENNLAKHVSTLRKALGERPDEPDCIITVQGRGYRFAPAVVALDSDALALRVRPLRPAAANHHSNLYEANEPSANGQPETALPQDSSLVPVEGPAPRRTTRWLAIAGGTAAVAAIGTLAVTSFRTAATPSPPKPWMLRQVTYGPSAQLMPAWSPDGRSLVYSSDRNGNFDLFVHRTDGSEPAQLTFSPFQESDPAWSPDGKWIAFRSDQAGGGIFVVSSADVRT